MVFSRRLNVVVAVVLLFCITGSLAAEENAKSKPFIPVSLMYLSPGPKLEAKDLPVLSKYEVIFWNRFRFFEIEGDTWSKIKALNPDVEIYLYIQSVDIWSGWGKKEIDRKSVDETELKYLNNISRWGDARGHSMGNLNTDNPDLFLLKEDGTRVQTYESVNRFLMDFGSDKFRKYWVEATQHDLIDQVWRADGIYLDNVAPFEGVFDTETPVKYNTDEKWSAAMNGHVNNLTKHFQGMGIKVSTNSGATNLERGWKSTLALDSSQYPPDILVEEYGPIHRGGTAATTFMSQAKWKRAVDYLSQTKNCRQNFMCHTKLDPGGEGIDNRGYPVTFEQSLWYALGSYLLGRQADGPTAYFYFGGEGIPGDYDTLYWFDEYDRIDLGNDTGKYQMATVGGANVYFREFENGYVYVNPTEDVDATGVALPEACKQLTHETINDDPAGFADVTTIDLKPHHAAILMKSASLAK